jgi:hypothetical protein
MADGGLRPLQPPGGPGEAAGFGSGDKNPELIESYGIEHDLSPL